MEERVSPRTRLVALSESDRTLESPLEDIRGRSVVDRSGDEIGTVDDLMLDEEEGKVRFLKVGAGGFLGLGERHFLIPVDAVTRVDDDRVTVDQTRDHIAGAPVYDPETVEVDTYWHDLYDYYGVAPYWAPGYAYPPYPYAL